jgi:hypothetical protein
VAYGARLEIVLGVKTLAGSNPASSATNQHKHHIPRALATGVSVLPSARGSVWGSLTRWAVVRVQPRYV